jgi:glycyl-tRNA synthetase beta chain
MGIIDFMWERLAHLLERRGFQPEEIRVVRTVDDASVQSHPSEALKRVAALAKNKTSPDFRGMAFLFKRVKNITKEAAAVTELDREALTEPAERALLEALDAAQPDVAAAAARADYTRAFTAVAALRPAVDRFFTEVFVMAEDARVRTARLTLMATLRDLILALADISEIVPHTE